MRHLLLPAALAAGLAAPAAADPLERFGTTMKYGLPLAAAVCAADQDRLEDFAVRGVVQAVVVLGLKTLFDGSTLGQRPSGEGRGFPSGHSAAAGFGAADLAGKCWRDDPGLGALAYGAAGLTAVSRVHAGEHTAEQAVSGALIGIGFGAASFGIGSDGAEISFGLRF
ncbi:MAG: phosphatase PAP2 family protein [Paracoccus sp. (in: a-proteobacteria)]|uniref:phosphatase PAP2 family protein n=1 Tax=Paracoccus sp. TaxID=267 RepID=UPI002E8D38A0|nr:phosphatase PAP2 family protein [Pseudomonadota bacterium]